MKVKVDGIVYDSLKAYIEDLALRRVKPVKELIVKFHSEQLSKLEQHQVLKVLSDYGYIDLADVQYWHQQDANDPEPAGLLKWYAAYDDAIWNEIDSLSKRSLE